jgi:benzoylformate decarboxylase
MADLHGGFRPQATVRDRVFDLFRAFGTTTIFGNPGSTELPMFRDFPDDFRPRRAPARNST